MSRIITNTNIIVDDFDFCKSFPKNTFVHFLTHFHSDHYQGLSPLWDYGSIHCSHQTKKFILNKYPKLSRVYSYDFRKMETIMIGQGQLSINFYLFDAKHIPGSSMILFQGYMGTILFTGDFRYQYSMIVQNPILFPLHLRGESNKKQIVQKMEAISVHIDEMIFDNTYCHQSFKFETEDQIGNKIIKIIQANKDKKIIYIAMGALGKHRILVKIAQVLQTSIVVSQKQLNKCSTANLRIDFLTTNPLQGYIHLISKKNRQKIINQTKSSAIGNNFICIDTDFLMLNHRSPDGINYIVPYSLHSNFNQMKTFIKLINPCILRKLVIPYLNFKQIKLRIKIDHRLKFAKYLDYLENKLNKSNCGYSNLIKYYTDITKLSQNYLKWFKPQQFIKLNYVLKIGEQNHKLRKRQVILLNQQQLNFKKSKSNNLSQIANKLNSVNNNLTLQQAFSLKKQNQIKQIYEYTYNQIFKQ